MTSKYQIIQVPDEQWAVEQLGTKFKFWYLEGRDRYLFKSGREKTGENWAEKVACEIAELLCIPHAHYELAQWKDKSGVITKSFKSPETTLIHGNEILRRPDKMKYGNNLHAIPTVMGLMGFDFIKPSCHSGMDTTLTPRDVFIGYLMLDALIGNSDRHDENWAFISDQNSLELAPTFDHASSLGRNESDEKRKNQT